MTLTATLKLHDPDGGTAVDFLDAVGTSNPRGVPATLPPDGFTLGQGERDREFFAGDAPGAALARSRHGLAETTFRVILGPATSDEALIAFVDELSRLLDQGGTIEWKAGGSPTKYIDFLTGDVPGLWRGQHHSLIKVLAMAQDPDGLPVRIFHHPHPRGAENPLGNVLKNALLILDSTADGRPDDWSWDSATGISAETWDESRYAYQFALTGVSLRVFRQTVAGAAPGDVYTFSAEGEVAAPGRLAVRVEFLDSGGVPVATHTSVPLDAKTFAAGRFSVTTAAAPAGTTEVRASFVAHNAATGPVTYRVRLPQLEEAAAATDFAVGPQFVSNDPSVSGGCVLPILVGGEAGCPARLIVEAETGASLVEVLTGIRSADGGLRDVHDYVNVTKAVQLNATANGSTITLGTDTTDTSGVARITHATTPTTGLMRVRAARTTRLDSLRGEFEVWVRVKAASAKKFWLQLRWGLGTSVVHTEDEVSWDVTGGASDWVMIRLGTFQVPDLPAILDSLTLELWTRQDTATAVVLEADYFWLRPVGERAAALEVPSGLAAVAATEQFRSDPSSGVLPLAEKTDQDGGHRFLLDVEGPTPLVVRPRRIVAVALKFGDTVLSGDVRPNDVLARQPTVTVRHARRYNG